MNSRPIFAAAFLTSLAGLLLLIHSPSLSFWVSPLKKLTASDAKGVCGSMRLGLYGLLPLGDKLYVGGYLDSSNPKKDVPGYTLSDGTQVFHVYSLEGETAMAKELNGKLAFGWFLRLPYNATQRLSDGSCKLVKTDP